MQKNNPLPSPAQRGPCIVCGDTNYPASMGGPNICHSCDCGIDPKVKKLEAQLASLRAENKQLKIRISKDDKFLTEIVDLKARITQLEEAIALAIGFCVNARQTWDDWQDHQEIGVLFAKLTTLSKPSSSMEVHNPKNPNCMKNQYFDGELGKVCTCGIRPSEIGL